MDYDLRAELKNVIGVAKSNFLASFVVVVVYNL